MAWESRGGRRYYYSKKRIGKRVISTYIGSGLFGEMAAEIDYEEQEQRRWNHQEWKNLKEEVKAIDRELDMAGDLIRALIRANLLLYGYHPHKGQWRKRRND